MKLCPDCGELILPDECEPVFRRPDAFMAIPTADRSSRARGDSNDLCVIDPKTDHEAFFIRAVLPFEVEGRERPFHWGIWVKVDKEPFFRIYDLWDDETQHKEPPFEVELANKVPSYPDTMALGCLLQLQGPTERPKLHFVDPVDPQQVEHPFSVEYRLGVSAHRAHEWLMLMGF